MPTPTRREFLKWSTAATAATAAAAIAPHAAARSAPAIRSSRNPPVIGRARNLIFMVSDGMSFGTLTLADMFRRRREERASHWVSLFSHPAVRRGLYKTHAADSLVTDSAASGSSWGCGHRVNNGVLNITSDGVQRMPLALQARQSGKRTGLVTTTRVTHATPASFIANMPRRDWEGPIAAQMLERRIDVLLGGGAKHFTNDLLSAHTDITIVRDRDALLAAVNPQNASPPPADHRLLGLFSENHIPFVLDRTPRIPSLAEMTRAALKRLDTGPAGTGFVLQVEGGRVDHSAHSNDAASLIREQLDFDDAISAAVDFSRDRDDTLLIITTDHGNANPGLTVYGREGDAGFDKLAAVKHSLEWFAAKLKTVPAADRIREAPRILAETTGVTLDADDCRILGDCLQSRRVAPFHEQSKFDPALGGLLANHFGVGFVSGNHTADYVEVTALGPGSEQLEPTGHNADIHRLALEALALEPGELLPDMHEKVRFPEAPKPD